MIPAQKKDVESPEATAAALYDVISGPAGERRDWERFASLFHPGARIMAYTTLPDGRDQEGTWSVREFAETAAEFYARDGFWEKEIWSRTDRYGSVAHVLSTYESRVGSPDSPPLGRGVNSIQMVRHDGRWWITSLAFELESEERPIPAEYGGKADG